MASSSDLGKNTTYVSFICQQCYQPLKIDSSIHSLDLDSCLELENTSSTFYNNDFENVYGNGSTEKKLPDISNVPTRQVHPARGDSDNNGFFFLGESSNTIATDKISQRLKVTAELFDVMSGNTEIDHPLCEDCTDNLLNQLDSQLNITEKELESYKELLAALEKNDLEDDDNELEAELKRLTEEEASLLKELEEVEKEYHGTLERKKELEKEEEELDKEEQKYWREYSQYQQELLSFEDNHESVHCQLQYVQNHLDKLQKTNVFNSAFHIWHKGHFGTINNFRLGRLPSVPVEWTEINAAWGQTVLLLHSLAKKIGLTFLRYRLVPYGNHSFLECLDDKSKELPLYGSGGFRFFWNTKFDQAMVAFLDCLQQFKEEVEKGDSKFYLPYRMEKGKIFDSRGSGSYSVKIQFNSEEHWTKALKFMLTNLKWGLAWVSSQFADKTI